MNRKKAYKKQTNSYRDDVLRKFKQHRLAMIGLIFLVIEIVLVFALPPILQLDANRSVGEFYSKPSLSYPFGTDSVGRDLFARVLIGGRVSITVGIGSACVALLFGVPLGLLAGYFRGPVEMVIMRLADSLMSFPSMILILALSAALGPSITILTIILGFLGWPEIARLLFANVISIKEKEYVESAVAIGTTTPTILRKYIIPNGISPILISFTFRTAAAIIQESSLSFLGVGVPPPTPSWGNIMFEAQSITVLSERPWVWLPSGALLLLTVLSVNFVGDGLRDALDPKTTVTDKKYKNKIRRL